MREIKFRALYKSTNEIVDVESIIWDDGKITNVSFQDAVDFDYEDGGIWSANIDDVILLQYTGFKDKEEFEIYEGDIVEQTLFGDEISKMDIVVKDMVLDFSKLFCGSSKENKIIGNIYENSELLGERK